MTRKPTTHPEKEVARTAVRRIVAALDKILEAAQEAAEAKAVLTGNCGDPDQAEGPRDE